MTHFRSLTQAPGEIVHLHDKINQKIMLNLLARMGYEGDLAADGREAIEAVTVRFSIPSAAERPVL